jgi:hypothetical protein
MRVAGEKVSRKGAKKRKARKEGFVFSLRALRFFAPLREIS